ncbi:hypothetical protein GVAV_000353 [Gurleya vavrai]
MSQYHNHNHRTNFYVFCARMSKSEYAQKMLERNLIYHSDEKKQISTEYNFNYDADTIEKLRSDYEIVIKDFFDKKKFIEEQDKENPNSIFPKFLTFNENQKIFEKVLNAFDKFFNIKMLHVVENYDDNDFHDKEIAFFKNAFYHFKNNMYGSNYFAIEMVNKSLIMETENFKKLLAFTSIDRNKFEKYYEAFSKAESLEDLIQDKLYFNFSETLYFNFDPIKLKQL